MYEKIKECPQFKFFGASYPDACCIDGILYDLDHCDDQGNLYEQGDNVPCPFCKSEDHVNYYEPLLEAGEGITEEDIHENRTIRQEFRDGIEVLKIQHNY